MIFVSDGRAKSSHESIAILNEVAVDDALDDRLLSLSLHYYYSETKFQINL